VATNSFYSDVYNRAIAMGIPPVQAQLAAAQASLETGFGRHVKGNNYFGIKAGRGYGGKTQRFGTHEVIDGQRVGMTDTFRAYDGLDQSLADWWSLIQRRYPEAARAGSLQEAARAVKAGGYATDPKYDSKLISIGSNAVVNAGPLPPAVTLPETGPELAFAPRGGAGFDPFSLIMPAAHAAEMPQQPQELPAGILDTLSFAVAPREAENASMSALRRDAAGVEAAIEDAREAGRLRRDATAAGKYVGGLVNPANATPADETQPSPTIRVEDVLPGGDPAQFDTLTIMQNPDLSVAVGVPFADQTPLPRLPMEELTYLGDNGTLSPAAPIITGNGIDTFTARPMPAPALAPDQFGPPMPANRPAIPPQQLPKAGDNIPTPTPRPTAKPGVPMANVLGALGGLLAAFDQGSPEINPPSLPGYAHRPQNTQIPIPRGLL